MRAGMETRIFFIWPYQDGNQLSVSKREKRRCYIGFYQTLQYENDCITDYGQIFRTVEHGHINVMILKLTRKRTLKSL